MRRYAVIGSPVRHSLSPMMQQAAFDALDIAATYEAIEATTAQPIAARLLADGFSGWNVTTPLKEQMLGAVDSLTDEARRARAVNAVRREGEQLIGHNTDGAGFVRAVVELWSAQVLAQPVLILGSGPAARAIALALSESGADEVACWARSDERARLVAPLPQRQPHLAVWAMPPAAPVPPAIARMIDGAALFFDCNYGERTMPRARPGQRASDGLPLLLHQGALAFTWWTGIAAPEQQMREALARAAKRQDL